MLSDFVVVALPFEATAQLLPALPPAEGARTLARQIESHEHWPICSVHLWFDREITDLEHAVLLDREIHWMYNQSRLQGRGGNYIELVVSATRAFAALPREEAIDQALRELAEFFPRVKEAKVEKVALVKEVRATFGVPPGIDAARPGVDRRGRICSSLATGYGRAGLRRWRARRARGTWRRKRFAAAAAASALEVDLEPRLDTPLAETRCALVALIRSSRLIYRYPANQCASK